MNLLNLMFCVFVTAGVVALYYIYGETPSSQELEDFITPPVSPPAPLPAPIAPEPMPTLPNIMLPHFCQYITEYEGKPGDLNYQLNNPGDCRPSPVGYLARYQPVVIIDTDTDPQYPYHKGKFAKFPSFAIGMEYLENMVHTMAVNHPNWTIRDFFNHFSPSSDHNNPDAYALNIAGRCGVTVDTTLAQLFG